MSRTDIDAATLASYLRKMCGDGSVEWCYEPMQTSVLLDMADMLAENAKLREERDHWHVEQVHAYGNWEDAYKRAVELEEQNAKLRELATYALKYIIEVECEAPDRERFRGKPCEDCVEYGSSDCPKCMPRMFGVSGIEVD